MGRGQKIILDDDTELILSAFLDSLDTRSAATKAHMESLFKMFINEVGSIFESNITQQDIDHWVTKHEYNNPNINCRYFLTKFGNYLETINNDNTSGKKIDTSPFFSRPIKTVQPPKNRKIPDKDDVEVLFKACKHIQTKHISPKLFEYYLRFIWEAGLRKSEPLKVSLKDFKRDQIGDVHKVLIRGKGNRHRWVIISPELFGDIVDYYMSKGIISDVKIFPISVKNVEAIYSQVCRLANEMTKSSHFCKFEQYQNNIHDKYTGFVKKTRKKRYIVPTYSLHKFRTARATEWYKNGVSLIEIQRRLGHQSSSTTQRYIDEEEEQMLKRWGKKVNAKSTAEAIEDTRAVEAARQMLLKNRAQ